MVLWHLVTRTRTRTQKMAVTPPTWLQTLQPCRARRARSYQMLLPPSSHRMRLAPRLRRIRMALKFKPLLSLLPRRHARLSQLANAGDHLVRRRHDSCRGRGNITGYIRRGSLRRCYGILGVRDLFGLAIGEPLCTCYFRRCGGHVLAHPKFCTVFY